MTSAFSSCGETMARMIQTHKFFGLRHIPRRLHVHSEQACISNVCTLLRIAAEGGRADCQRATNAHGPHDQDRYEVLTVRFRRGSAPGFLSLLHPASRTSSLTPNLQGGMLGLLVNNPWVMLGVACIAGFFADHAHKDENVRRHPLWPPNVQNQTEQI